jgi:hypothetical protein
VLGSRLLPLVLATAAFAAAAGGLGTLALWLGLLTVPAAAATTFVAVSGVLEGQLSQVRAVTSGLALALVVVASAARSNAPTAGAASPVAMWALFLALVSYTVPFVVWVLRPARVPRPTRSQRRLRPAEVDELLSRAA